MKRKLIKILKITGISLLTLIVSVFLFIIVSSRIGTSTIRMEIEGLGTKLMGISSFSHDGSEEGLKFAFSFNDRLYAKISNNSTREVNIGSLTESFKNRTFRSKRITFFLEPSSNVNIMGKSNEISIDYDIIEGNDLSHQYSELRKLLLPYYEVESELYYQSMKLRKTDPEKSYKIEQQFDSVRFNVVAPLRTEWAKQNLHYELSARYLLESHIPRDTVIKYYDLMPEKTKGSSLGQYFSSIVSGWEKTEVGKTAPFFEQITSTDNFFSTDSLLGKYAVIHFWGTWCGPCMSEIQKMREFYDKYNTKIEFVSIACNDKYDNWTSVIENYNLNWVHLLNDRTQNDLSLLYGIQSFPTKFIIDKDGKIVESFTGATDDFYEKLIEIAES